MKLLLRAAFLSTISLLLAGFAFAQAKADPATTQSIKSSPAYAELVLRRTEVESNVESLLTTYTEEYPKLKESRHELELLNADMKRLLQEKDASRLTLALGKMMVRKNELLTDLWVLRSRFKDDHPDVKRALRRVDIFTRGINELLP
jgi:uncharacterized protein involved in exopolysaccharide biosynthesis